MSIPSTYRPDGASAGKRGVQKSPARPERAINRFWQAPLAVVAPPPNADVSHGITSCGMDGNADVGDCVQAATDHYNVAKTGDVNQINKLGGVGPQALYCEWGLAQGAPPAPGTSCPDNGTDPRSWLDWCVSKGIIYEWGEIADLSPDTIHQAMIDFKGVLITVDLPPDAEQQFNAGQPWSIAGGENPNPNAGHAILLVRYDPTADYFWTWGALQPATVAWDAGCITGAFVIFDADDPAIDAAALEAYIAAQAAHGGTTPPPKPAPAPPTPGPTPPPKPGPPPETAGLEELLAWCKGAWAWIEKRIG